MTGYPGIYIQPEADNEVYGLGKNLEIKTQLQEPFLLVWSLKLQLESEVIKREEVEVEESQGNVP